MITISNLTNRYGKITAVDNLNLSIQDNQVFALLGVNGAGKTTTIKMLTGLIAKDCGTITYDNLSIDAHLDQIQNIINISPQETAIAENLTVLENVTFIAQIYGMSKSSAQTKAMHLLEQFDLVKVANKLANTLSGGTKRRLSIAMALVTNPRVLFLDEPTLGVDVLARNQLWKLIEKLKSQMTIVLTTHYMEEAEHLADTIAVMNNGKVLAVGTTKQLLTQTETSSLEHAFIKIVEGNV
jgi:ABC-2 type transport system ATP-binding protein